MDSPYNKAIQPLRPRQAKKLERGVALEELRVRDRAARGFQVEPALGVRHLQATLILFSSSFQFPCSEVHLQKQSSRAARGEKSWKCAKRAGKKEHGVEEASKLSLGGVAAETGQDERQASDWRLRSAPAFGTNHDGPDHKPGFTERVPEHVA